MVQPATGVLGTPWLCHAWTRGTHTCSGSIQDCTCSSIRILHLILTGRSVGCCSVEKRNNKSFFFLALVELFPAQGKRFVHILTSRDSRATPRDSVRTVQLLLTQRHGNSWVSGCALGSGCIASLTLNDLCVCVAFPVSVCVNSYMCLPCVHSFLNTVCYGGEWEKKQLLSNK